MHIQAQRHRASGSHAIGLGALLIQNGLQEMVVCGGAQEANPFSVGSFDGISAFSVRESEPEKASRPFDRDRDGLVPGGGAATVILEEYAVELPYWRKCSDTDSLPMETIYPLPM